MPENKKSGPPRPLPHCRLNCKALSYIRSFEQKPIRNYEKPTQYPQFEVERPFDNRTITSKRGNQARPVRNGAGNGVRTRDTKLGKLVLYQLSYARSKNHFSPFVAEKII